MSLLRDIAAVRANAGVWARGDHTILVLSGRDAVAWLHAQSTNHVAGLTGGAGNLQALLDRQGRIQAIFSAHRWEDEIWMVVDRAYVPAVEARVESHVILEDVVLRDVGGGGLQICVEGPGALPFLAALDPDPAAAAARYPVAPCAFAPVRLLDHDVLAFRLTETREDGFLIVPDAEEAEALFAALADEAAARFIPTLDDAARDTLRLESGWPRPGVEMAALPLISATPYAAEAVAFDKGCFPGQEVVARVRAYGSPKHALAAVVADDPAAQLPEMGANLRVAGARVGEMGRSAFSPALNAWLCLAYLDRDRRAAGSVWRFESGDDGAGFEGRVLTWPAVVPTARADRARALYDEALTRFEADHADTDGTVLDLLREALVLAPDFEDACEVLGVALHRQQRTDEAIAVMKRLEALNPSSVMAHTNLSVFYVAKGMIAEAEAEKAVAQQLEFKRSLDTRAAQKAAEAERARLEAEARERIGMFREVLEIDPEDTVANMGLGSAYIQLGQYADAVAPLEATTRANRDYSAAWLNLGKCHEFLGHAGQAIAAYTEGIAAASRKGDFMPLREMERRLRALRSGEASKD